MIEWFMIGRAHMPAPDDREEMFHPYIPHVVMLVALFLSLRLAFLLNFPIFNDEANFIQYAQIIHSDWDRYKFISVNNIFGDWKPPLIFWIGSPFIDLLDDPLLAARLVAVVASVIGLLSIYCLAGYYFESRRAALWAGLFWTLNPMVLFYDRVFIAETFVYSFTSATWLFALLTLSRSKWNIIPAVIFGTLSLLTKQTAQLFIPGVIFLAVSRMKLLPVRASLGRLKTGCRNISFVVLIMSLPFLFYRMIIPASYFRDYGKHAALFTLTADEVAQFPAAMWLENAKRIAYLYLNYYSLLSLVLVLFFLYQCVRVRGPRDIILSTWFAATTFLLVFAFRYFNEYIYHTAVVALLTLICGAAAASLERAGGTVSKKAVRYAVQYGVAGMLMLVWIYSCASYYRSPRDYITTFGSPWMKDNYYLGWSSGFGVDEVVALLRKEQFKFVYLDPQWGNPATGIMAYSKWLPSLTFVRMAGPILEDMDRLPANSALAVFKFRPDRPGPRLDSEVIALRMCDKKTIFQWDKDQVPLIVCRN